jgi:hypothetical protein
VGSATYSVAIVNKVRQFNFSEIVTPSVNRLYTGCAAKEICAEECLDSCIKGCPPVPADLKAWKWLGQQCYVVCHKDCKRIEGLRFSNSTLGISNQTMGIPNSTMGIPNTTMGISNETMGIAKTTMALKLARNVFNRGIIMSDEAMFQEVDGEGLGHFSYDQFLQKQGWQDSEGARAHFDRYAKSRSSEGVKC